MNEATEISTQMEPFLNPVLYGSLIIVGIVALLGGFKLFKLILSIIVAFASGGLLAWAGFEFGSDPVLWSIAGFVVGILLGAILAFFFYKLAVATIGATAVGLIILPWLQDFEVWMQIGIIVLACGIAALISVAVANTAIRLGTSVVGGFFVVYGVAFFTTGIQVHTLIKDEDALVVHLTASPWITGSAVLLSLFGFFWQLREK